MSSESSNSIDPQETPQEIKRKAIQKAFFLLNDPGFLSASADEKEDTSPQETNKHSSASASSSSAPPTVSATPSKRPLDDTDKDEDESQGKEKKKKEEPDGGDTKDKKPKEAEPLEPHHIVQTNISLLRHILDFLTQKDVHPLTDDLTIQDFVTNWLGVDVLDCDVATKINQLRDKYTAPMVAIVTKLNDMEPLNGQAFLFAHEIWSTKCNTDFPLSKRPLMTVENFSTIYEKESIDIQEAETIFLGSLAAYCRAKKVNDLNQEEGRNDFISNWVKIEDPNNNIEHVILALKSNYQMKVRKMLKNEGVLGPFEQVEYVLATKIWGDDVGNSVSC